jgi:hypothetical protein
MKLALPTLDQIRRQVIDRLAASPITALDPGSVARALIDAVVEEIGGETGLQEELVKVAAGAHAGTAAGAQLDGIFSIYGAKGQRLSGESDASYLYRMSQRFDAAEEGSLAAIESAVRQVDQIKDTVARPFVFGPGSFAMVVLGGDPNEVSLLISTKVAPGTYYRAYSAQEVSLRFTITPKYTARATTEERLAARSAIDQAIRSYIMNLGIGDPVLIEEVQAIGVRSHPVVIESKVTTLEVDGALVDVADVDIAWDGVAAVQPDTSITILGNI